MKAEKTLGHGEFMRKTSKNGDAPLSAIHSSNPLATAAAQTALSASERGSSVTYSGQLSASGVPSEEIPVARPDTNAQVHSDNRWARFKIILELTSIANALSALCLAAVVAGAVFEGNYIAAFIMPPAFSTIVWNLAEVARLLLSSDGIPPGAHVGVRLLLWLVWLAISLAFPLSEDMRRYADQYYGSQSPQWIVLVYIIVVLCVTAAFLEFTLFVRAGIEENRRLKAFKAMQLRMGMKL